MTGAPTTVVSNVHYSGKVEPRYNRPGNKAPNAYQGVITKTWIEHGKVKTVRRETWSCDRCKLRSEAKLVMEGELVRLKLEALNLNKRKGAPPQGTWHGNHPLFTMKGRHHDSEGRANISKGMKRAYAEGRRPDCRLWLHKQGLPPPVRKVELPNPPPSKRVQAMQKLKADQLNEDMERAHEHP